MSLQSEIQYFEGFHEPNPLTLESGKKIGPVTLAYETYGKLNDNKSNAILICHALSGDSHAAYELVDNPEYVGWWDMLVGPGKEIDTNKHFVICSNVIGGCRGSTGPQSQDPKTGQPYGLSFPFITIGDMVKAQKGLMDYLGIDSLKMVIGGSMGGMQVLEWVAMYPEMVRSAVPIAAPTKLTSQALAFDAVGRNAIMMDPNWAEGNYYNQDNQPEGGLSIARMIGHITYISDEQMDKKFGRKLQEKEHFSFNHSTDFQIESYLKYQGNKFVDRFDSNSYIYLTKAISYFDLEKKYGTLENAFEKFNGKSLIISISSDWLYTPEQSKQIAKALIKQNKDVTYCDIDSNIGHDAFLVDNPKLFQLIKHFLKRLD